MSIISRTIHPRSTPGWATTFSVIGPILQSRSQFFAEIRQNIGLTEKIRAALFSSIVLLAIYGAVLGSGHPLQALSSAIKLPLAFLGSLLACTPTLYIFDILLGSKRSLSQTMAILLAALTAAAVLLFSFVPITVAFRLTVSGYQFFKLLNVVFILIAISVGVFYLGQGLKQTAEAGSGRRQSLLYAGWIILFVFMIGQIAWSLRPFFQYPGASFLLFAGGGNVLIGFGSALGELLGFWVVRP